jgi:pimeloyl-ACP methyl ester carboxylesterase
MQNTADHGFSPAGLKAVRTAPSKHWDKIECWKDTGHLFAQEKYLAKLYQSDTEIVAGFGSQTPETPSFLLHYGKRWKTNTGKTVILVHGATDNANRAWGRGGPADALERAGCRVFAITFPHKHGDLFYEAAHLASAVKIAREATGAERVALVAHSAGGLAARLCVSQWQSHDGFEPCGGDVERLITLATPHGGMDFIFRHPQLNSFFMQVNPLAGAPMSWDKILCGEEWKDTIDLSVYGDYFPMQRQILSDWRHKYPVNPSAQDWEVTYDGGQGVAGRSQGIRKAIVLGGGFIAGLDFCPVDSAVAVTLVGGKKNEMFGCFAETDGVSDGLVFLESACAVPKAGGADVQTITVDENHLSVISSPAMLDLMPALVID